MHSVIPPCYYRLSSKGLIRNAFGEIMLIKEMQENGSYLWELPGGGVDYDEHPIDALKREIKEETGLEVIKHSISPAYFFTFKDSISPKTQDPYLAQVIYHIKVKDLNFTPSNECSEIKFFTPKEALEDGKLFPNVERIVRILSNSGAGGSSDYLEYDLLN